MPYIGFAIRNWLGLSLCLVVLDVLWMGGYAMLLGLVSKLVAGGFHLSDHLQSIIIIFSAFLLVPMVSLVVNLAINKKAHLATSKRRLSYRDYW